MRLPLFLLLASFCAAQTEPKAASADQTRALQSVQAMGISPLAAKTVTSVVIGKLTLVGDNPLTGAITYKTSGLDKFRSDFEGPDGTTTRIVNSGSGVFLMPGRHPRKLSKSNTLFEGIHHIPALSRLAQAAEGTADVLPSSDSKASAPVTRVAFPVAKLKAEEVEAIQNLTAREFEFDQATGYVAKMRFRVFADDDGVSSSDWEIVYSDYRLVSGIAVPFHQQQYLNGKLRNEIQLESVEFNVPLSEEEFALPEVT
jgi:hypothetical protein